MTVARASAMTTYKHRDVRCEIAAATAPHSPAAGAALISWVVTCVRRDCGCDVTHKKRSSSDTVEI